MVRVIEEWEAAQESRRRYAESVLNAWKSKEYAARSV